MPCSYLMFAYFPRIPPLTACAPVLFDQKTTPCWKVWDAPPLTVSSSPVGQPSQPFSQPWALQYCWMAPLVKRAPVLGDQWICPFWKTWDVPPLSFIPSLTGKPRSCRCF